ncbi:MAG TPA: hypothetical protein VII23_11305 [Terriglobales bacterium]|jgi:hypothetical protein
MFNIRADNENRRTLRLTWFVAEGNQSELRYRWLIHGSKDIAEDVRFGSSESSNLSLTKSCETEMIAIYA